MKTISIILALALVAAVAGLFYLGHLSRQGQAPGLVSGRLADCPESPNCVSSENGTPSDQSVDPLPVRAWPQLPGAVETLGGTVTTQEPGYISAEFTSSLFKFTDDIEFRLTDDAIHVRSASRVGHSDLGANQKRVEALRAKL